MDFDLMKRQRKSDSSSSPRRAAVCPTQINLTESWSTVRTQIIRTANNTLDTQDWSASQDSETNGNVKIFTSMMLRAWRRRRADVQRLQLVVENLKSSSMQTRNELHVCNSLMRVEQKRCEDLQLELKKSTLSINQVRNSCDMLNTSVLSLTADKKQLEDALTECQRECEKFKYKASKNNEELLAALLEHRNLQHQLENEKRYTQQLIGEKLQVEDELKQLQADSLSKQKAQTLDLTEKQEQLEAMNSMMNQLERQLNSSSFHNFRRLFAARHGNQPQQVADLALTSRNTFLHIFELYGIDHFFARAHSYAKHVAFLLWLTLLPQSLRSSCIQPKDHHRRITEQ
ncbi:nuclear mitotic apparatus protein 1 isoform X1 [Drosophila sulfurigaster albostrigata]|uniref:nuclear mitotic apparatus protein 1 isoform X1 n=1 Tax=Drosophila sulfurigaster albostrigata TaxID=89887 RepID=UPI002D21B463|nr:nuclear mitotic apparatus protein 1 isoform X1 [Drosophila sulfurigaster albostrigata]